MVEHTMKITKRDEKVLSDLREKVLLKLREQYGDVNVELVDETLLVNKGKGKKWEGFKIYR
jgi:hypothetical protein